MGASASYTVIDVGITQACAFCGCCCNCCPDRGKQGGTEHMARCNNCLSCATTVLYIPAVIGL